MCARITRRKQSRQNSLFDFCFHGWRRQRENVCVAKLGGDIYRCWGIFLPFRLLPQSLPCLEKKTYLKTPCLIVSKLVLKSGKTYAFREIVDIRDFSQSASMQLLWRVFHNGEIARIIPAIFELCYLAFLARLKK